MHFGKQITAVQAVGNRMFQPPPPSVHPLHSAKGMLVMNWMVMNMQIFIAVVIDHNQ